MKHKAEFLKTVFALRAKVGDVMNDDDTITLHIFYDTQATAYFAVEPSFTEEAKTVRSPYNDTALEIVWGD